MRQALLVLALTVIAILPIAAQEDDAPTMQQTQKTTAQLKLPASKIAPNVPLNARERAVQMLNRFTYGARPGEVERVLAVTPDKWFDQQLNPASAIPDPVRRSQPPARTSPRWP